MNDPILSAYLRDFGKALDLSKLDESKLFEFFSAYCVFFRDFSEHTSLEDAVTSGGQDSGIDAVGIFLNDIYVNSKIIIDEFSSRQRIDVDFAFLQSKRSRNLSASEIGSFIQGVKEFFGDRYMPVNEEINDKRLLSDHVFSKSVNMRSKPRLHLYYCYTGNYIGDVNIESRVSAGRNELMSLNLFSDVTFTFLDSNRLQDRYQEINLRVEKEVRINEYASLPQISGIRQAYIGVIPCIELVKLISNSDGKLQKSLFNENVRDFLSSNPVNDEISSTVSSTDSQSRLAALNNGITIVAREIRIVGKNFTLADFQIVNGCQTSHVIFDHKETLLPDTSISVKIIEAEDKELINEIVRATNRQTEVKDEAFVVLGDFHKRLERFFGSMDHGIERKLVYERRKRQYAESNFTSNNIVTLSFITSSFVACYLENPVDAIDYYGVLLKRHARRIFVSSHSLWPYLVSSTILREIEKVCSGKNRANLWKFRFIICLLFRKSFGPAPGLSNDSRQQEYAEKIISFCHKNEDFIKRISEVEIYLAKSILSEGGKFDGRNAHQDRKFVEKLIKSYRI